MNFKQFKQARFIVAIFIAATVSIAVTIENTFLALAAVIIGMIFMILVRKRTNAVLSDERTEKISGVAARATYGIFTSFIALLSLFLILSGRANSDAFTESVGTILSFTALLSMAIFALSYRYYNKKYGDE